jgi:hypothetical protein
MLSASDLPSRPLVLAEGSSMPGGMPRPAALDRPSEEVRAGEGGSHQLDAFVGVAWDQLSPSEKWKRCSTTPRMIAHHLAGELVGELITVPLPARAVEVS